MSNEAKALVLASKSRALHATEQNLRAQLAQRVPDGLVDALKEASANLSDSARVPLGDELNGFALMLSAAPAQPEQPVAQGEPVAAPPGIDALNCVISSLRDTSNFSDEEGELTDELRALRDWALSHPQQASKPMTDEQIAKGCESEGCDDGHLKEDGFYNGVRFAERFHQIGGPSS
jgi:hypothetical protein